MTMRHPNESLRLLSGFICFLICIGIDAHRHRHDQQHHSSYIYESHGILMDAPGDFLLYLYRYTSNHPHRSCNKDSFLILSNTAI